MGDNSPDIDKSFKLKDGFKKRELKQLLKDCKDNIHLEDPRDDLYNLQRKIPFSPYTQKEKFMV